MQIPPQEDWSLELLNELQRAVPVLESSSFGLDDEDDVEQHLTRGVHGESRSPGASSEGWVLPRQAELSHEVAREETAVQVSGASNDLLSDDAMALPMSTLTSGKRKTYSNKSTFQAHVCCVMHPSQVPHVLKTLQVSPHFQTVRHWPHAYRIISPFDGQAHEGSCDGEDAGAGEKMLALLTRMGLENLLLIISRWDTGAPGRLGSELFRCVNEQCKELLRELQQAVRASFPPEELLRPDFVQNPDGKGSGAALEAGANVLSGDKGDSCADEEAVMCAWEEEVAETERLLAAGAPLQPGFQCAGVCDGQGIRQWDMSPLGGTPVCPPRRFYWVTKGVFDRAQRLRYTSNIATARRASVLAEATNEVTEAEAAAAKAAFDAAQLDLIERSGLKVGQCPMSDRVGAHRQLAHSIQTISAVSAEPSDQASVGNSGSIQNLDALTMSINTVQATLSAELEASTRRREIMTRMTSEELLQFSSQLRVDRQGLEDRLGSLGKATEVITNLSTPFYEGTSEMPPSEGSRAGMTSASPIKNQRVNAGTKSPGSSPVKRIPRSN